MKECAAKDSGGVTSLGTAVKTAGAMTSPATSAAAPASPATASATTASTTSSAASAAAAGSVRRPMNAFLIFCKRHRRLVREKNPHLDNRSVTRILGELWANLPTDEKASYTALANEVSGDFEHFAVVELRLYLAGNSFSFSPLLYKV